MASGAVTLGELVRRLAMLDVACSKCSRSGRYRVADLVAKYGADTKLPDLRSVFATDCPRMNSIAMYDQCGVSYPHLPDGL
jgi:hypothetical protein